MSNVQPMSAKQPANYIFLQTMQILGKAYSLDGSRQPRMQQGVNIVKMSDGTTRKVIRK